MTTTPYKRRKAWIASLSPERKARHKAARRQLARIYRPLKRSQPLCDDVALAVVGMRAAEFVTWVEAQWRSGWTWANYGSTDQGAPWNFDHVRTIKHFNVLDPREARDVNHWTNLAPMCSRENDRKQHR